MLLIYLEIFGGANQSRTGLTGFAILIASFRSTTYKPTDRNRLHCLLRQAASIHALNASKTKNANKRKHRAHLRASRILYKFTACGALSTPSMLTASDCRPRPRRPAVTTAGCTCAQKCQSQASQTRAHTSCQHRLHLPMPLFFAPFLNLSAAHFAPSVAASG